MNFDLQGRNVYLDRGDLIAMGNDFEVYEFTKNIVVKLPRTHNADHLSYDNKSQEYYDLLVADYAVLKEMLGDFMAYSEFYPPNSSENANYRIIQQRFTREEFLGYLDEKQLDAFTKENRHQILEFIRLVQKARKHFGIAPDITPYNLAFHRGKLIYTENDCISLRAGLIKKNAGLLAKSLKDGKLLDSLQTQLS